MKNGWLRIVLWLALMAILTALAMIAWMVLCGGSQSTASLKWLQLMQTMATFLLPPILCAWIWDAHHRPFAWLGLNRTTSPRTFLLAIIIMISALPGINLLADLNSRVELPECLDSIEQMLKSQEETAMQLTERFLQADNLFVLLLNIGLMALLPAIAEELSFRGTLLQLLAGPQERRSAARTHMAIWLSAAIFSAIHMQFYGFVPRMLMGALFGYMFVWTGTLWVPILMHFINNALAAITYYFVGEDMNGKNYADTLGAGTTWWVGLLSLIIVALLLWITILDLRGYDRKTHIQ